MIGKKIINEASEL